MAHVKGFSICTKTQPLTCLANTPIYCIYATCIVTDVKYPNVPLFVIDKDVLNMLAVHILITDCIEKLQCIIE